MEDTKAHDHERQSGEPEEKVEYVDAVGVVPQAITSAINEKKLLRKIDLRVLPPLAALFLLAFLDRTNIGNARIQGMIKDLKMVGQGAY
jgi:hypothetical protein